MFIRAELKQQAKQHFHRNLWLCIGVTFFVLLISGELFGIEVDLNTSQYYFRVGLGNVGNFSFDFIEFPVYSQVIITLVLILTLAFNLLFINPIKVGLARFFIDNRSDHGSLESLFKYFNSKDYLNVVKVMLLHDLYITLWTLCFVIPGIIKSYEYFAVQYILAENPTMDSMEVFEISKQMTRGYKFDIFVLELSFILWILSALVTFGLSSFYVNPYILATNCEAYYFLKQESINNNFIEMEEKEHVEPTIDDLH